MSKLRKIKESISKEHRQKLAKFLWGYRRLIKETRYGVSSIQPYVTTQNQTQNHRLIIDCLYIGHKYKHKTVILDWYEYPELEVRLCRRCSHAMLINGIEYERAIGYDFK